MSIRFAWPAVALLVLATACGGEQKVVGSDLPSIPLPAGRPIFAIDAANRLVQFGSQRPEVLTRSLPVTGLVPGELLLGIDFRPRDGRLYAITSASRVYVIDTLVGSAIAVGTAPLAVPLAGGAFGFDFNPVADRIRVHSDAGQNLRLRPDSGSVAAVDSMLAFGLTDINAFDGPSLVASAYSNNVDGATGTTLYAIDSDQDILVRFADPNDGRIATVGPLGINTTSMAGFDIAPGDGAAFVTLTPTPAGPSRLYAVDLSSGQVREIGIVGTALPLNGIAIVP